jgi:hypothetical protein
VLKWFLAHIFFNDLGVDAEDAATGSLQPTNTRITSHSPKEHWTQHLAEL